METPNFKPEIDIKDCPIGISYGSEKDITIKGRLIVQGKFVHVYGNKTETDEPKIETIGSSKNPSSGIISVTDKSAPVRLLYEGKMVFAYVSYITRKAWRLDNDDLGWAWVPKNVIRWAPALNAFCITESDYFPKFIKSGESYLSKKTILENPEFLLNERYEEE